MLVTQHVLAPDFERSFLQALAGACFFLLLLLPHRTFAIPCLGEAGNNVLALNEGGNGTITRTYDGLNRVTSYSFGGNTIGYRCYPSGKLAKLIYPGGTETGVGHVEYTYNADGRLSQVIDKLDSTSSPRTTSYYWNTDGRLQSISRPNGTTRSILYDAAGRPYNITESAGLTWAIGYWTSDDIKSVNVTPAIPTAQLAALPNAAMNFDSANQLATFNGQSVTHDLDGNMLTGPIPATGTMGTYVYDSRNRLTSAGNLTYTYNAENSRVAIGGTETTTVVVDPTGALPKVLSRTKNGITTCYVYGAGLQYEVSSAGVATYYHFDQTGNTAALSNQAGTITDRLAYSPYGTIRYRTGTTDTPFLFGGFFGVMTDANGLINMRARYYNPLTMRFINSDPARDGMNWYAYANGNPINFADPSGFGASRVLDAVQVGLTALGFAPGIGIAADIVNAGISGARGDAFGAGLSLASAVPIIGDAAGAGRMVRAATQVTRAAEVAAPVATAAKVERAVVAETRAAEQVQFGFATNLDNPNFVIFKSSHLEANPGLLRAGESTLNLPKLNSEALNWAQNQQQLQKAMSIGKPIRDLSPSYGGGFLQRERDYLIQGGWRYQPNTGYWSP